LMAVTEAYMSQRLCSILSGQSIQTHYFPDSYGLLLNLA
jgi:hypothetical protein